MTIGNAFLIGFIFGGIIVGIVIEKTRRPVVIENSIKKIKNSDGAEITQSIEPKTQPKKRKKFLGIFKRKER